MIIIDKRNIYKPENPIIFMKKIEIIRKLENQPLFTFNEFVRITGKNPIYARIYLYRLKKGGLFYNFTEQLPREIMIASPKPKKAINFKGTKIRFFKTKHLWGYKKQRHGRFDIFVAEKEKCIIFDEIMKAVETKDFDPNKLIEYAIKVGNKSAMKRLGFLMEYYGLETEELEKNLDNNYVLLDWNMDENGKKNVKWKIIVNRDFDDNN